jgi:predicted phosphate transport protein (TIGR00153 family)
MDTLDMVPGAILFAHQLHEHASKVRKGMEMIQPLADALLAEDRQRAGMLRKQLSEIREEADQIIFALYGQIKDMHFQSLDGYAFSQYLACQGRMIDALQEFAGLLIQRRTLVVAELHSDFQAFVAQVADVSRQIMNLTETASASAEALSAEADIANATDEIRAVIDGSRRARHLAMTFAQHLHHLETQLDPLTVVFLDRCCTALKEVTDSAERTASHLRLMT